MADGVTDLVDWIDQNQGLTLSLVSVLTLVIAVLTLAQPWRLLGWWWDRRAAAPKILFSRVPGESDEEIVVQVVNAGPVVASDVRFVWSQRSPCTMKGIPQPAVLRPGEPLVLTFVIAPLDLHLHQFPGRPSSPLGLLELWYRGKSDRLKRTGFALIVPAQPVAYSSTEVTLSALPRRSLGERSRIVRGVIDLVVQPKKRAQEEDERQRRADAKWYADAQAFLTARGIPPGDSELTTVLLADELGRRGWHWEFAPGGNGYEASAKKHWFPSSSHSISFSAAGPEEALAKVLAAAIREDEARLNTPTTGETSPE